MQSPEWTCLLSLTLPFGVRTYPSTIENTCSTYLDKFLVKDSLICKHDTLYKVACLRHVLKRLDKSGYTGDAEGAEAVFTAPCIFTINRPLVVCGFFWSYIDIQFISCVYYCNLCIFNTISANYACICFVFRKMGSKSITQQKGLFWSSSAFQFLLGTAEWCGHFLGISPHGSIILFLGGLFICAICLFWILTYMYFMWR